MLLGALASCLNVEEIDALKAQQRMLDRTLVETIDLANGLPRRRHDVEALERRVASAEERLGVETKDRVSVDPSFSTAQGVVSPPPVPSMWDGEEVRRRRSYVVSIQKRLAELEPVVNEVNALERRRRKATAALEALEKLQAARSPGEPGRAR